MSSTMNGAYIKYLYVTQVIPEITDDLDVSILKYYNIAYDEFTIFFEKLDYE